MASNAAGLDAEPSSPEGSRSHHRFDFFHHRSHPHPRTLEEHGEGSPRRARLSPRRLMSLGNEKDVWDWHSGRQSPRSPTAFRDRRTSTPLRALSHHENLSALSAQRRRGSAYAGAKPVAPSWHPDAPEGLKVASPNDASLLPELPLAGMASSKEPVHTLEERVAQASLSAPRLETDKVIKSETVKLQRPAIKVRIVTWNQGNSVPKGDLGVLLGRVGEYIAPEADWDESGDECDEDADDVRRHKGMGVAGQQDIPRKDRIPPLPHDDAHPYHVVIVAGQECPWGDGKRIATGVGLAGELGDLARSKSRAAAVKKEMKAKERGKDKGEGEHTDDADTARSQDNQDPPKTPGVIVTQEEDPFSTALPLTPGGVNKARGGGRGWSEMCEDWLCRGPLAQATATKGLAIASSEVSNPPSGLQSPQEGNSPAMTRSPSPVPATLGEEMVKLALGNASSTSDSGSETPNKRVSLVVPQRVLHRISRSRVNSAEGIKLAQSSSPTKLFLSTGNPSSLPSSSPPSRPTSPMRHSYSAQNFLQRQDKKKSVGDDTPKEDGDGETRKNGNHRIGIRIPGLSGTHHVTVQSDGTPSSIGAYELVCKERCYMMYMAVYVWRGCLDRVRGCSQGHVKSGLLSGRVGNKGAVGISLKLGQSRLLFVNAHLAAHEGKVAERIANVEKIKKELKVDTFLPKDDPRNREDDITSCFDYAFWFGDLNFRVDITRKHADWLVMKKQYEHALAFDQLRKVMKEQPHIFYKFHEAAITFPPTFKYDVLKTIKQKKQSDERRAAARQAESIVQPRAEDGDRSVDTIGAEEYTVQLEREDDRSSISSAVDQSSFGLPTDVEEASSPTSPESGLDPAIVRDDVVAFNTAAAEKIGMHGKAIRMRNRFLHVVQTAVGAVAPTRDDQAVTKTDGGIDDTRKKDGVALSQPAVERKSSQNFDSAEMAVSTSSSSFQHSTSMESHLGQRRPLRNSVSFARLHAKDNGDPALDEEERASELTRQVYDSSAKQRVPSWCDRVLWRSNVEVAEDVLAGDKDKQSGANDGATSAPSKISVKLSNALSRLHAKVESAPPPLVPPKDRDNTDGRSSERPQANNDAAKELRDSRVTHPASPKWYNRRTYSLDNSERKDSASRGEDKHGQSRIASLTHEARVPQRPRKINRSESADAALLGSSMPASRLRQAAEEATARVKRASAPPVPVPESRAKVDRIPLPIVSGSPSPLGGGTNESYAAEVNPMDRPANRNSRSAARKNASDRVSSRKLPRASTMQTTHSTADPPKRTSRWTELLSHLAPLLVPQSSASNTFANLGMRSILTTQRTDEVKDILVGPKGGQVECMLYKSLDDREMRLLEGRSDHRPVIFVGSIGVGTGKEVGATN